MKADISCSHRNGPSILSKYRLLSFVNQYVYGPFPKPSPVSSSPPAANDEIGGPAIESASIVNGFGSTPMQRIVKDQFYDVMQRDWRSHGLAVLITLSLGRMFA